MGEYRKNDNARVAEVLNEDLDRVSPATDRQLAELWMDVKSGALLVSETQRRSILALMRRIRDAETHIVPQPR